MLQRTPDPHPLSLLDSYLSSQQMISSNPPIPTWTIGQTPNSQQQQQQQQQHNQQKLIHHPNKPSQFPLTSSTDQSASKHSQHPTTSATATSAAAPFLQRREQQYPPPQSGLHQVSYLQQSLSIQTPSSSSSSAAITEQQSKTTASSCSSRNSSRTGAHTQISFQSSSRGPSNVSSRKQTPDSKSVNVSLQRHIREIQDLENFSIGGKDQLIHNNNSLQQAPQNLKRKMKFSFIRNAYDRRNNTTAANNTSSVNSSQQTPSHPLPHMQPPPPPPPLRQIDGNITSKTLSFNEQRKTSLSGSVTPSSRNGRQKPTSNQQQQLNNYSRVITNTERSSRVLSAHEKDKDKPLAAAAASRQSEYKPSYTPTSASKFNSRKPSLHTPSNGGATSTTSQRLSSTLNNSGSATYKKEGQKTLMLTAPLDDKLYQAQETSFYETSLTGDDLNNLLPHPLSVMVESSRVKAGRSQQPPNRSFDASLNTTQTNVMNIAKTQSIYAVDQLRRKTSLPIAAADDTSTLLEKGQLYFKASNFSEAIKCLVEGLKKDEQSLEMRYLLGVCLLGRCEYERSAKEFLSVLERNPVYKKNVYLLLSIAFKKLDNISGAIRMLSKVLQQYPDYYDACVYRGKLFLKEKRWEKAEEDFNHAIAIDSSKGIAYLGRADSFRQSGKLLEAVDGYTKVIMVEPELAPTALLKRAIAFTEKGDNQRALQDLEDVLVVDEQDSDAHYYKGVVHYKQRSLLEAVLSFEQAIKYNNSRKSVTKSLFELAKIKIEERDFYQALHTLSRSEYLDTDRQMLEKFRLFTEGVIFLMKRKYKEGIENFSTMTQTFTLGDFLTSLFYEYRAYGYFCLGKHANAVADYRLADTIAHQAQQQSSTNSDYNLKLCEGILAVHAGQNEAAIAFFNAARKVFENKMEPLFYKGVTLIHKAFSVYRQTERTKDMNECILAGLKEIDAATEVCDSNAQLFYSRAVVRSYLGMYQEAIADVDKAIEKSEDNVPKYFFLRGHVLGCCKQYKQAVSDLSIAIQLDENYADCYLERAKCNHFASDSNNAFADLQKYISLRPNDPNIHLWAGNLLFNNLAYEDAIRAYSHSEAIDYTPHLLLLRSHCQLILRNFTQAADDLAKVHTHSLLQFTSQNKLEASPLNPREGGSTTSYF